LQSNKKAHRFLPVGLVQFRINRRSVVEHELAGIEQRPEQVFKERLRGLGATAQGRSVFISD
jgi:hypothetical protein